MPFLHRVELTLRALTGLALVVAAAALLWPSNVPENEIAPAGLDHASSRGGEVRESPAVAKAIVAGNIFSAARRAPSVRYRPTGPDEAAGVSDGEVKGTGVPTLYGIVPTLSGVAALLRLDPSLEGARLYRVGEGEGRYRVQSIGDESVILSGPRGRVELKLAPAAGAGR